MLFLKYESMKIILIFLFFTIATLDLMSKSITSKDTAIVMVDSLAFNYPIEKISFMLDGKLVYHSAIFKDGRQLYKFVNGFMSPLDAIRHYGEKYRNGLLMYKKEENE